MKIKLFSLILQNPTLKMFRKALFRKLICEIKINAKFNYVEEVEKKHKRLD
jgi:hypothetical protein